MKGQNKSTDGYLKENGTDAFNLNARMGNINNQKVKKKSQLVAKDRLRKTTFI